jgi:transposase
MHTQNGRAKNLNDDKIYYELNKIDENQQRIENHLFKMTYKNDKASYDFVNYDLSSSYFVGMKCDLSQYGRSKDDKSHNKQVILGLLINNKGYPFKWDIYPGNTAEVDTLVSNVYFKRLKTKLFYRIQESGVRIQNKQLSSPDF